LTEKFLVSFDDYKVNEFVVVYKMLLFHLMVIKWANLSLSTKFSCFIWSI